MTSIKMNTAHPDFDTLKQVESHEKAIVIGSGFGGLALRFVLQPKAITSRFSKSSMRWEVEATPTNRTASPSMAGPPLSRFPNYLKSSGNSVARR